MCRTLSRISATVFGSANWSTAAAARSATRRASSSTAAACCSILSRSGAGAVLISPPLPTGGDDNEPAVTSTILSPSRPCAEMRATESCRTRPSADCEICRSTRICGRGAQRTNMICATVPTLTPETRTGAPCTRPATSPKVACSCTRCSNTCLDLPSRSTPIAPSTKVPTTNRPTLTSSLRSLFIGILSAHEALELRRRRRLRLVALDDERDAALAATARRDRPRPAPRRCRA